VRPERPQLWRLHDLAVTEVTEQSLGERPERPAVLDRTPRQDDHACFASDAGRLGQEARLADARLTGDK